MENFVCPICGKSYKTAVEMANCVVEDDKKVKAEQKTTLIEKKRKEVMSAYSMLKEAVAAFNTVAEDGEHYTSTLEHRGKKECSRESSCCKNGEKVCKKVDVKLKDKDISPAEFENFLKTSDFKKVKDEIKKMSEIPLKDDDIEKTWKFLLNWLN